jgi:hypothetical protein
MSHRLAGPAIAPAPLDKGLSIVELVDNYFLAYNAARLREACQLWARRMAAPEVTVGLTLTGALTPAGLGPSCLVPLVRRGLVDFIVSTGANLYHDAHFALGLQREFASRGLAARSLVAHPGLSHTNLQVRTAAEGDPAPSAGFWKWLAARVGMDPDRGALPQLRAATDPKAAGGQMYAPRFVNFGAAVRRPILRRLGLTESIETLWEVSERLTGERLDFDVAAA